jgi:hypothetical protein
MQLDRQTMHALNLLRSAEMTPYVEYLKARRKEALERMTQVTDIQTLGKLQGEVMVLKQLVEDIEKSGTRLAK